MSNVEVLENIEAKVKAMGEVLGYALSKEESDELLVLLKMLNEIYSEIGEVINYEMVRNTMERFVGGGRS
ncbi:hypothetical protein [Priestia megaterium]|uniref:hypothetical protein n=1 Tax=Priestia megaterium TaxID=1404 RepID=UPI00211B92A6|nr:hypothetical protein [Priestia megaterium]